LDSDTARVPGCGPEKSLLDCGPLEACEKTDSSQTIINTINGGGTLLSHECKLAATVFEDSGKKKL
jgi:hypothetical protein